ncbi:MAG: hypothetical protein NVS2B16_17990 [Chloroflexota bacterium]
MRTAQQHNIRGMFVAGETDEMRVPVRRSHAVRDTERTETKHALPIAPTPTTVVLYRESLR